MIIFVQSFSGPKIIFRSSRFICCSYSCLSVSSDIGNTKMAAVEQAIHVTVRVVEKTHLRHEVDFDIVAPTARLRGSGNISLRPMIRSAMLSSTKGSSIASGGGVSMMK